jgi:hypothetical protein
MNYILYNLMLVNFISSIFYILYLIYEKINKKDNIDDIFEKLDPDDYDLYKKKKRKHISMYIFGILLGLIVLVITDSDKTKIIEKPVSSKYITHKINNVSDVSDIYVK